jgi:hypothetical protein
MPETSNLFYLKIHIPRFVTSQKKRGITFWVTYYIVAKVLNLIERKYAVRTAAIWKYVVTLRLALAY